jgi:hypothetical protein
LVRGHAINDPLVKVRGAQVPHPARECDVMAVMDLGEMVIRAGLLR